MASIFTFDPDPPRVSSPWSTPRTNTPQLGAANTSVKFLDELTSDVPITRLGAEPQEGPTEYKLHLLLRPRRSFTAISTGYKISGSHRSSSESSMPKLRTSSEPKLMRSPSIRLRQHRLEQLTTQLLWRLQQSSPHHSSSNGNAIVPKFPDVSTLSVPLEIGAVIPGLEETRGALYEIGVADDGTFVGLAKDEMDESISNLGAMAASLGCVVEVLRMVSVGECEWMDGSSGTVRNEELWVCEAYVKPNISFDATNSRERSTEPRHGEPNTTCNPQSAQLKVTLTGSTMSGKSSLLGSLTTATLDNGRGKSRLSLFRHRHEIESGMTSSVTQEILGYNDSAHLNDPVEPIDVVNYASGNISSWTDIHGNCDGGRLVLLSDSAGHPRYRRTAVRGLIGWAPDWTLLCIPADTAEDTSGLTGSTPPPEEVLGISSVDVDLSHESLELCLKLDLPLVVVITKLDLASMTGLKRYLQKVLSSLKAAGRVPVILQNPKDPVADPDLTQIPAAALRSCESVIGMLECDNPRLIVPIVLTSAVKGTGISTLHALLYKLPILQHGVDHNLAGQLHPRTLFHIEDVYSSRQGGSSDEIIPILSGHLRYGRLDVGDELVIGPYNVESHHTVAERDRPQIPTSQSFPGALTETKARPIDPSAQEWRRVKVTSLRYLRLPVSTLFQGQAGTVGVHSVSKRIHTPALVRIRKGMVLADGSPLATRVFVAEFARRDVESLSIRHAVVVYIASVKASAKVIAGALPDDDAMEHTQYHGSDDESLGFALEGVGSSNGRNSNINARMLVTFQFISSPEYVEMGSQVLVMPGGGPGIYGGQERGEKGIASLEGFVGKVVNTFG